VLVVLGKAISALTHDTIVAHDSTVSGSRGVRYATICMVNCVREKAAEADAQFIECDEVEFEFSDRSGRIACELLCIAFHSV
jgi:hypothetical protein